MMLEDWAEDDEAPYFCAHCGLPIASAWAIEIVGDHYHSATTYRGPDGRRCREAALSAPADK